MSGKLIFSLVLIVLILAWPLYSQEEFTISTYYPSPAGSYEKIDTRTLQYKGRTNQPFGCAPEHKGATYYNKADEEHILYFCDGEIWKKAGVQPSLEDELLIGGYSLIADVSSSAGGRISFSGWKPENKSNVGDPSFNQNYPCGGCERVFLSGDDLTDFTINFRNAPRGMYAFNWWANLSVNQDIFFTRITSDGALIVENGVMLVANQHYSGEANDVMNTIRDQVYPPPPVFTARLELARRTDDGLSFIDFTDEYADEHPTKTTATYIEIEPRTAVLRYPRFPNNADKLKRFSLRLRKDGGKTGYHISFRRKYPDSSQERGYEVRYDFTFTVSVVGSGDLRPNVLVGLIGG